MENSPLVKLPPEIREYVYELILQDASYLTINLSSGRPRLLQSRGLRHHPLALAQTCALLRHEAHPVFFRTNTFALETDHITTYHPGYGLRTSWFATLQHWLNLIGKENRRQLRSVDFDLAQTELDVTCTSESNDVIVETVWRSLEPAFGLFDGHRTKLNLRCKTLSRLGPHSRELRFSLHDAEAAEKDIEAYRLAVWKDCGVDPSTVSEPIGKYAEAGGSLDAEAYKTCGDVLVFVRLIDQRYSARKK